MRFVHAFAGAVVAMTAMSCQKPQTLRLEFEVLAKDQDALVVHVSEQVTGRLLESFQGPNEAEGTTHAPQPAMVKELFQIKGVVNLYLQRYQVHIHKGRMFTWNELRPQIEAVIRKHLTPQEEKKEALTH